MSPQLETVSSPPASPGLDTAIVGAGRAGEVLHHDCVRKAAALNQGEQLFSGRVVMVERDPAVRARIGGGVECVPSLADAWLDPARTVVHCAVGPAQQGSVIKDCARRGFQNFILEKPLALHLDAVQDIADLVKTEGLQTAVNFPWLHTAMVRDLKKEAERADHGFPKFFYSSQKKSRPVRPGDVHPSAFEVETPHQVSLALYLLAGSPRVVHAHCWGTSDSKRAVPNLGGASLWLRHSGATANSMLHADLDAANRERNLILTFEDGSEARAWFPSDGTNSRSTLTWFDSNGVQQQPAITYDDEPMVSMFTQAYSYFAGRAPEPPGTLKHAIETARIISRAKQLCNLEVD